MFEETKGGDGAAETKDGDEFVRVPAEMWAHCLKMLDMKPKQPEARDEPRAACSESHRSTRTAPVIPARHFPPSATRCLGPTRQ